MCDDHAERISVDWKFPSGKFRFINDQAVQLFIVPAPWPDGLYRVVGISSDYPDLAHITAQHLDSGRFVEFPYDSAMVVADASEIIILKCPTNSPPRGEGQQDAEA